MQDLSNGDSPSTPAGGRGHSLRRGDHERRSHSGAMRHSSSSSSSAFGGAGGGDGLGGEAFGTPLSERRSHGGTPRGPGFSGYVARVRTPGSTAEHGSGGFGGASSASSSPVVAASPLAPLDGLSSIERIERRVRESSPAAAAAGGARSPGLRSRESSFRATAADPADRWGRL